MSPPPSSCSLRNRRLFARAAVVSLPADDSRSDFIPADIDMDEWPPPPPPLPPPLPPLPPLDDVDDDAECDAAAATAAEAATAAALLLGSRDGRSEIADDDWLAAEDDFNDVVMESGGYSVRGRPCGNKLGATQRIGMDSLP